MFQTQAGFVVVKVTIAEQIIAGSEPGDLVKPGAAAALAALREMSVLLE